MAFYFIYWNDDPGENADKCLQHGFTKDDVDGVFDRPLKKTTSVTSGRPLWMGRAADGRRIAVPFDWVDQTSVYPITAYMPSLKKWNDAPDA